LFAGIPAQLILLFFLPASWQPYLPNRIRVAAGVDHVPTSGEMIYSFSYLFSPYVIAGMLVILGAIARLLLLVPKWGLGISDWSAINERAPAISRFPRPPADTDTVIWIEVPYRLNALRWRHTSVLASEEGATKIAAWVRQEICDFRSNAT
jgi:hypothetical protein